MEGSGDGLAEAVAFAEADGFCVGCSEGAFVGVWVGFAVAVGVLVDWGGVPVPVP